MLNILQELGVTPSTHPFIFNAPFLKDPKILKSDHWTFVVPPHKLNAFEALLQELGYTFHGKWVAANAHHLSFIREDFQGHAWRDMVGISVKDVQTHPVLDIAEGLQHGALNIPEEADFDTVCEDLGLDWLTPTLVYHDPSGATLRQRFTKPSPGIFFWEFVQRTRSSTGVPFAGFDPTNIHVLYTWLTQWHT